MANRSEPVAGREQVVAAVEEALASDGVASLLQLDIDRFGEVNASLGRETGDRVLAAAVARTKATAKAEGWSVLRLGGDELGLVAPAVGLEAAFLRAERLRVELDEAFAQELPAELRCTASIGVASIPRDAKTADELIRKTDLALFSAKDQGGDTVALTPGDEMALKSSYYTVAQLGRLKALAERLGKKEAVLLREALDDLLQRHDRS
jgi:diguanylate cyclase (GGDEF)-like protein